MVFSFLRKKEVIGLDIGSSSIKLVQLRQAKKGWELEKLGFEPLPPEAIVDGSIIDSMSVTEAIKKLLSDHKVRAKDTVSSLTGNSVIIKKVELPAMTEEELGESIQWEAEQYIPFPISEVNIDFQILGESASGKGQMEVMLVAVKKEVINDYINVIKEAGLNPIIMDVDAFALENMMEINYTIPPNENITMVNIGASVTSISVIAGGITTFTRTVPMGGNHYTEELQRSFSIPFKDAEELKLGKQVEDITPEEVAEVINVVSESMVMEVRRSVDFFIAGNPGLVIHRIMLCGGGAKTQGLKELINEKVGLDVEVVNPFKGINYNPQNFDSRYLEDMAPCFGVAVGCAVRRLGDR